jgi:hypothetical protein
MDLNYLLHRHQSSLMRAAAARLPEVRRAHRGLAAGYAALIADHARASGATAFAIGSRA